MNRRWPIARPNRPVTSKFKIQSKSNARIDIAEEVKRSWRNGKCKLGRNANLAAFVGWRKGVQANQLTADNCGKCAISAGVGAAMAERERKGAKHLLLPQDRGILSFAASAVRHIHKLRFMQELG